MPGGYSRYSTRPASTSTLRTDAPQQCREAGSGRKRTAQTARITTAEKSKGDAALHQHLSWICRDGYQGAPPSISCSRKRSKADFQQRAGQTMPLASLVQSGRRIQRQTRIILDNRDTRRRRVRVDVDVVFIDHNHVQWRLPSARLSIRRAKMAGDFRPRIGPSCRNAPRYADHEAGSGRSVQSRPGCQRGFPRRCRHPAAKAR